MKYKEIMGGKYFVYENGKVFSNVGKGKFLKGKVTKGGYVLFLLTYEGERFYKLAHRLVAENFLENVPGKNQVNHKDGNKENNKLENLEWCNSSENLKHARDNGLCKNKINMEEAEKIRNLYKTGNYSINDLTKIFGIKKTSVGYIIQNKRWAQ